MAKKKKTDMPAHNQAPWQRNFDGHEIALREAYKRDLETVKGSRKGPFIESQLQKLQNAFPETPLGFQSRALYLTRLREIVAASGVLNLYEVVNSCIREHKGKSLPSIAEILERAGLTAKSETEEEKPAKGQVEKPKGKAGRPPRDDSRLVELVEQLGDVKLAIYEYLRESGREHDATDQRIWIQRIARQRKRTRK